jgi:protein-L-isoaspartate(D-aspartate) O-methyltransferase
MRPFFEKTKKNNVLESILFHQVKPMGVLSESLKTALLTIDRAPFLPPAFRNAAYADAPIVLKRRCEIPFLNLALLLEGLKIQDNAKENKQKAAVISAGAGYSSTILSYLCDHVEAYEGDSSLFARLLEAARSNASITPVTTLTKDLVDYILFDGGAIDHIPEQIIQKLTIGGKIAIIRPVEEFKKPAPTLRPDAIPLSFPLCNALIFTKIDENCLVEMPQLLFQCHLPRLNSPENQKESFHF